MTRPRQENATSRGEDKPSTPDGAHLETGEVVEVVVEWKPGKQEWAVMFTIALISLMVALDATILVSVLPTLAVDLGGSATDAFWAGTSYLLSCAVCQPFIASLSDIFGRKEMLLASVLFFTIGTVLCAPIASSFTVFFAGRAVQGIGGGGIITMGQVIFADIVPLRQRPKYFSLVLAAWALGSVLGPLIGGLFVEHAIWAWCFYVNIPFCALGLILVPLCVNLTTDRTSLRSKLARVDWMGGFLFIGGLTSFLVGMSWAGVQFQWKSVQVLVPMMAGVAAIVACFFWEKHVAREPFLRPSLFYSASALAAYACALFQGFILFCALYYVPFYFTSVHFERPTQSGLDIFPVTCVLLPGSILVSLISTRTGRYRWAIWSGWAITSLGCGLLALFDQNTPTPVWATILAVFGVGHGILLTSVNVAIQAISTVADAGRAAAMYAFMRTLGMAIGVAVGGTVFQNRMIAKLQEFGMSEDIAHDSEAFVPKMAAMDPDDPIRVGALEAYVAGFHGVYWTITGASVAALLVSLIIKRHTMNKSLDTRFTLQGAATPMMAGVTVMMEQLNAEDRSQDTCTSDRRLPPVVKDSNLSSQMPSAFDLASVDSISKDSEADEPEHNDQREKNDIDNESEDSEIDMAAVAYFVEASGKIVPVSIKSDEGAVSQMGSVFECDINEEGREEGRASSQSSHQSEPPSPEELFEQAWGAGSMNSGDESDHAEHEAAFANLAPAWMYEGEETR
ncbi:major facilitator superfamily domain-containing protein [Podospora australis]|uniref:Major facilitator superfamily domain-containing protein n=1 Tax=Podospora australis TaxID=1536484 RepID=A0AAN7AHM6_9PEZI|nr:major facilitator superfamily domain-containing protein [Podospora australis]